MADMKKVELLAPAGNFDALTGALKAGADAVYLGGALYGARAYADNFTQDEICTGIHLAHVFGRRIYLTVNTLIKEKELDGLYNFLLPFYECGLDGVIVQDLGALRLIRKYFPHLSIHASTQMALTGSEGASFMKAEGVSRIVPARELSLAEIKSIKQNTGLEIETFVHGAMCYCYSGQCLFSSILGGRSGNRGRCAQPCRLPYKANTINLNSDTLYPLSMRDMCTISMLPELIEAGIDSFKIEGRMKKPAYAAGVTAIYRKYIDLYYEQKENFQVAQADMKQLKSLYIRSQTGNGYYKRHNGKEMLSLTSPAYSGSDEKLLADIQKKYIEEKLCHEVTAKVCLKKKEPSLLILSKGQIHVSCTGEVVQKALKQPLSREKIKEQIKKCGNSPVKIMQVELEAEEDIFLPVSSLNALRRNAAAAFEKEMIRRNGFYEPTAPNAKLMPEKETKRGGAVISGNHEKQSIHQLHAAVNTKAQLLAALNESLERIYLDYGLLCEEVYKELKKYKQRKDFRTKLYVTTPYIVREGNLSFLEEIKRLFSDSPLFEGVLVRNLESYYFLAKQGFSGKMILDANLYLWNHEAVAFWEKRAEEFYLPVECNLHEWKELLQHCGQKTILSSAIVYGRLPMMITANCLSKTGGKCSKIPQIITLKDRYEKQFPVYTDCLSCINIIYNSVPLSLHKLFENKNWMKGNFRLDFTTEDERETVQVIRYFKELFQCFKAPFYKEYTTGHLKRGVE